jgi:hypothetical protein
MDTQHYRLVPPAISVWLKEQLPVDFELGVVTIMFFVFVISCYCCIHQNARTITNLFFSCLEGVAPQSVRSSRDYQHRSKRKIKRVAQTRDDLGRRPSETPLTVIQYADSSGSDEDIEDGKVSLFPSLSVPPLDLVNTYNDGNASPSSMPLRSPGRRRSSAKPAPL